MMNFSNCVKDQLFFENKYSKKTSKTVSGIKDISIFAIQSRIPNPFLRKIKNSATNNASATD